MVYIDGCLERVPGATLTYDPAKTSGADYVYVELLKYNYGYNQDAVLINPATGEPTAEGLNSLLQNLAERTFDQAGSYLVKGLDSFIGDNDGENVEVITNAGRAYIQGFRLQKDLPTTTLVPKSIATKSVRGEQKTYVVGTRRYALNSTPLKESTQVEAIVEIVSNITRGSVGGGEDLLVPNPVVDILEVSQGATVFQEGVDWQQSGNYVD